MLQLFLVVVLGAWSLLFFAGGGAGRLFDLVSDALKTTHRVIKELIEQFKGRRN
jgi:hypothetical protein